MPFLTQTSLVLSKVSPTLPAQPVWPTAPVRMTEVKPTVLESIASFLAPSAPVRMSEGTNMATFSSTTSSSSSTIQTPDGLLTKIMLPRSPAPTTIKPTTLPKGSSTSTQTIVSQADKGGGTAVFQETSKTGSRTDEIVTQKVAEANTVEEKPNWLLYVGIAAGLAALYMMFGPKKVKANPSKKGSGYVRVFYTDAAGDSKEVTLKQSELSSFEDELESVGGMVDEIVKMSGKGGYTANRHRVRRNMTGAEEAALSEGITKGGRWAAKSVKKRGALRSGHVAYKSLRPLAWTMGPVVGASYEGQLWAAKKIAKKYGKKKAES